MGLNNFNRRRCIKVLKKLGFKSESGRKGKHDKYKIPDNINNNSPAQFIMIPRHNKLRCQNEIIKELRAIDGDELVDKFRRYL